MRVVEAIENPAPFAVESNNAPHAGLQFQPIHCWGGKMHYFPEDFKFPNGGLLEAWRYWCVGDQTKNYPPLKRLTPDELSTKNLKKRLCGFKFLMNKIEERASELEIAKVSPSEEEAITIFNACASIIQISPTTTTGK